MKVAGIIVAPILLAIACGMLMASPAEQRQADITLSRELEAVDRLLDPYLSAIESRRADDKEVVLEGSSWDRFCELVRLKAELSKAEHDMRYVPY